MRRPFKTLRIIGKRHEVLWNQQLEERYADFTPLLLRIRLVGGLQPDDEKEALLHEITHAIDLQMNLGLSEEVVRQLSIGLFAVLKDNPKLGKYLTEEAGE